MRHHLAAVVAVAILGASPATAQSDRWTPPRAADGRVDLQGVWANNAATPLERPDSLADKRTFTDEELARLQKSAQRLFGGADDAAFGDGVFNAVLADVDKNVSRDGGTGNYSSVWMVDREFENRTSLITDPPNGKLPALTPPAEARIEVAAEYRRAHPAPHRALHARRARKAALRDHRDGRHDLDAGVDRHGAAVEKRGRAVRIRLPRGEHRHGRDPGRDACPGSEGVGRRSVAGAVECSGTFTPGCS